MQRYLKFVPDFVTKSLEKSLYSLTFCGKLLVKHLGRVGGSYRTINKSSSAHGTRCTHRLHEDVGYRNPHQMVIYFVSIPRRKDALLANRVESWISWQIDPIEDAGAPYPISGWAWGTTVKSVVKSEIAFPTVCGYYGFCAKKSL